MRWKPLGLYNGMTATCAGYAARAALWYQGESNTGDVADDYGRMLAAMIGCWRRAWGQERLPFLIVQLPVFSIDGVEDGGWPLVRKHQWEASSLIEDVATVVTLDAAIGTICIRGTRVWSRIVCSPRRNVLYMARTTHRARRSRLTFGWLMDG